MIMPTLLATYLIGFIVFYLFEIQDTEKFSQLYLSMVDFQEGDRDQERQKAKQVYALVVLVGSVVWPVWTIRNLLHGQSEA